MSVASMTGFAREAGTTGPVQWAWEVRSVNGRGLDVRLRVPPGFDAVGEEARAQVQKRLARGQCQLTLTLTRSEAKPRLRVDEALLASLLESLSRLRLPEGVRPASLDGLLQVRGIIEVEEGREDPAVLQAELAAAAGRLAESLLAVRREEGRALAALIDDQLARIAALTEAAEACPARRPEAIRARLAAQVATLSEAGGLDPDRLHQEAVLLAAKADVREEIDRLRAHVTAARDLVAAGGAIGRRLDFLAQEFGREANTLCAKANDIALSRIGLDLKAVVEQFREQVQNVE
ncbi:MAG: YicC family protein [Methylobacterium sp.]|uniref:YicC/YloC family endoribonuclease n=1 Tax=Methylobacterium sp. TaxID=409 RepID=UPI0025868D6E|nr:YicC/YloC family endoribonuclease [Methylobacterium sp.]MBY0296544.1 YicC family protein [Methylobacterium sp.]